VRFVSKNTPATISHFINTHKSNPSSPSSAVSNKAIAKFKPIHPQPSLINLAKMIPCIFYNGKKTKLESICTGEDLKKKKNGYSSK